MNKKLYKLMNWADIEEIIYSECNHPQDLLGPHATTGGTLIQAYFPGASAVSVKWLSADPLIGDQVTIMELADEDGYFAVILPEKKVFNYTYSVTYETVGEKKTIKKKTIECGDPYRHEQIISKSDIDRYCNGDMTDAYNIFGSKIMSHSGEKGTLFSVWAPNALRVSVIGEFNNWDGRIHQMKRIEGGFYELFIPGVEAEAKYQYELKLKGDIIIKRNDPFSTDIKDNVSVVKPVSTYKWNDDSYMKNLKKKPEKLLVYEMGDKAFSEDIKKIAKEIDKLIKHVKMQGYKYIQINPQAYDELSNDSISYLYAANNSFMSIDCLKEIVDKCHASGIGVIFNWNASGFGRAQNALANFDGTALYEHQNPMQGISANGKKMLFQYGKNEVISFLLSNGMYWIDEFHADGICLSSVAEMMYLDYGKKAGEWIPNIYGDNENLEAVSFIKKFISLASKHKYLFTIAEDSSTHAGMTASLENNGMGFDYKWNEGYICDFFDYMSNDPINRNSLHSKLVDEFIYSYAERFIVPLSKNILSDKISVYDIFAGDEAMKKAALRLSIAFQYMHPGSKLINSEIDGLESKLCCALNKIFEHEPAIGDITNSSDNFEWLSNMKADGCYISYIRKTDDPEEMMIAVINFAGIDQTITTGVPYEGKYEEILNTDDTYYGGSGTINKEILRADAMQADGRPQSITVKLAAQSMTIMKFIPYTEAELAKVIEERIRNYTPVKRTKKNGK